MEPFEKEFSQEEKEKLFKDAEENIRLFEKLVKEAKEEKKAFNKKILKAEKIPSTCINKCEDCGKDFEAKISIEGTCKECHEEFDTKVKKKLEEVALKNPLFKKESWQNMLIALWEVSEEKAKNKAKI